MSTHTNEANESGKAEDDFVYMKQKKMRKVNVNMGNKDTATVKEAIGKLFAYRYGLLLIHESHVWYITDAWSWSK